MARRLDPLYTSNEKVGERVAELWEKVLDNPGQVILTFRRVYLGSDRDDSIGMIPPESYHGDAFETGVISGELRRKNGGNGLSFWTSVFSHSGTYFLSSDLAVPVRNKLAWHDSGSEIMRGMIDFPPRDIRNARNGDILISSYEFLERDPLFDMLHPRSTPYLERLEVLVGDDEIQKFLIPFIDQQRITEQIIVDFLHLMKTPGEIGRRVEASYAQERVSLAERLVGQVSSLNRLYAGLLGLQERVLKLRVSSVMEQDGPQKELSDGETYRTYIALSGQIRDSLTSINGLLDQGMKIHFERHPTMRGDSLGFPAEVSTRAYLKYVGRELLPKADELLAKLRTHVSSLNF